MHYDPGYPTILPPIVALVLVLALNILMPLSAIFISRAFKRGKWLPHLLAFLWVLASMFTFSAMGIPEMAPDEVSGPGEGMMLLPVIFETAIVLAGYLIAVLWLPFRRLIK